MAPEGDGVPAPGPLHCRQGGHAVGRLDPEGLSGEHDSGVELFAEEGEVGEDGGEYPAEHPCARRRRRWRG